MSQSYEFRRKFAAELLEASFFGALITAIGARKTELQMTQSELALKTGREKTGMSKLLSGPRNWKLSTISDLAEALDLRLEFSFVDNLHPHRRFTATGVQTGSPISSFDQPLFAGVTPISNTHPGQFIYGAGDTLTGMPTIMVLRPLDALQMNPPSNQQMLINASGVGSLLPLTTFTNVVSTAVRSTEAATDPFRIRIPMNQVA